MLAITFGADDWKDGIKIWGREVCRSSPFLLLFPLFSFTLIFFPLRDADLRINTWPWSLRQKKSSKSLRQPSQELLIVFFIGRYSVAWDYFRCVIDFRNKTNPVCNDKIQGKQVHPTWHTVTPLSLWVLFSQIKERYQGCAVLVCHRLRLFCPCWHSSKHLLSPLVYFFRVFPRSG